jgi:hypothetical protein
MSEEVKKAFNFYAWEQERQKLGVTRKVEIRDLESGIVLAVEETEDRSDLYISGGPVYLTREQFERLVSETRTLVTLEEKDEVPF